MTRLMLVAGALVAAVGAGCAGHNKAATPTMTRPATTTAPAAQPTTTTGGGGPGALQAEANATAAGDIPDNQVFLVFRNRGAGYSMKYPEGWSRRGTGKRVTFRDKNNIVRVVVGGAGTPTKASVQADVARLRGARTQSPPESTTISGAPAFKVVYSTESAPNAVTGKRVKLVVDRYYLSKRGRRAVVDLGTPEGVDNVDAYRLMIESFRWS
jgi:hypothetical protein